MANLISPKPRLPTPMSTSSSSCPSPCPSTPRSILRTKCLLQRTITPCGTCHVRFSECIDEHTADDYDRSKCETAVPTFREIRELERIRRELIPCGRGISDQDDEDEPGEMCFGFDDEGDVDYRPRPKRRLRGVPIELCPILPANAPLLAPTPYNSNEPSPLNSPAIAPIDNRRPFQPRAKMTFLPILPPSDPPTPAHTTPSETPIPTPPETPTLLKLDLYDDVHSSHPPHVAPPPTEQRRVSSPKPPLSASSPMSYVSSPSRPPPNTCRMAIMPVLSQHSMPPQRSSPAGSPRQYGPISSMSTTTTSVYSPLPMSFKRTART